MSKLVALLFAGVLAVTPTATYAQDEESGSAMQQLEEAAQDSQEAVEAPTDEEAKEESGETFDTPHDSDGD